MYEKRHISMLNTEAEKNIFSGLWNCVVHANSDEEGVFFFSNDNLFLVSPIKRSELTNW